MDENSIQAAIDGWLDIREMLTPSADFYSINDGQKDRLTLLSVFSARQETWEFLVGAAAYLDSEEFTLENIVESLGDDLDAAKQYIDSFITLPVDDVFSAGFAIIDAMSEHTKSQSLFLVFDVEDFCKQACADLSIVNCRGRCEEILTRRRHS